MLALQCAPASLTQFVPVCMQAAHTPAASCLFGGKCAALTYWCASPLVVVQARHSSSFGHTIEGASAMEWRCSGAQSSSAAMTCGGCCPLAVRGCMGPSPPRPPAARRLRRAVGSDTPPDQPALPWKARLGRTRHRAYWYEM